MYRPDKYMHRPVGVPYVYEKDRKRPQRKKMFNFYESSFHTVQPTELPRVPNRWVSEIRDNFVYYVTESKSPNQPYRHNYDLCDPLRTTVQKFVPHVPVEHGMPLEHVVPPRARRPQTAPEYDDRGHVGRSGGGSRRKKRQRREQQRRRRRRSEEIDVEESIPEGSERQMPPERKKVFTKAEETKFHSGKTKSEREEEQRDKAIERLKRKAFDGVTNVKPIFVLPEGARPEFCNYGHGNINPIREENYMKSYNVKAGKLTELHDYITQRRDRTHGYDEWRKYMGSTPTNFHQTDAYKKKKLTRPKTPPRMHKAKKEGYRGVSHYFGGGVEQTNNNNNKKRIRRRRKKMEEEEEQEISPRKKGPPKPQPQPQPQQERRRRKRKKKKKFNVVAPSRGNLRKYMDEELEEVMEHGLNVDRDDEEGGGEEEDDDGEILVHQQQRPTNETARRLTKIVGGKVFAFEPKRFNNEDWNPRNYKHLPNEYTCFIRSAGVRTIRDQDKSVYQALRQQFD